MRQDPMTLALARHHPNRAPAGIFKLSTSYRFRPIEIGWRTSMDETFEDTMERITADIAMRAGMSVEILRGRQRTRKKNFIRQYIWWRLHKRPGAQYTKIGRWFDGRDHAAIWRGVLNIEAMHQGGTLQARLDKLYGGRG